MSTPNTPKPGIYYNIPFSEYRSWNALNQSLLKAGIEKSMAHLKYLQEHAKEDTPSMSLGRMVHTLILEPKKFDEQYAIKPENIDRRTKAGKAEYQVFEEAAAGKQIITQEQCTKASAIANEFYKEYESFMNDGEPDIEVSVVWKDEETDVLLKARLDIVLNHNNGVDIYDLKTTSSPATQKYFSREATKYMYHVQAAYYCDALSHFGHNVEEFFIFALETTPPYMPAMFRMPPDSISLGRSMYRDALRRYAKCVETDVWPGYELADIKIW